LTHFSEQSQYFRSI